MVNVYIADKSKTLVDEFSMLINRSGIAMVKETFRTSKECREKLLQAKGVLLLGAFAQDGDAIDFCAEIRQKNPGMKVLMIIAREDYSVIKQLLDNGASGYIMTSASPDEIISGVQATVNGKTYLGDKISIPPGGNEEIIPLVAIEQDIIKLKREGCADSEIAEKLKLTVEILDTYKEIIIKKLLTNCYSNREISEMLCMDFEAVRVCRMDFIQKLGERNSMVLVEKKVGGKKEVIKLSRIEMRMLKYIAAGYRNEEIKLKLNLALDTVKTYRRDLISKFNRIGANNTMTMVMEALRLGLIKLKDIHNI